MKVITLWQPWASFIAMGWKTIETRTHDRFSNLAGETIGIHAGNTWDKNWKELAGPYMTQMQIDEVSLLKNEFDCGHLKGEIICTAYVGAVGWLNNCDSKCALIDCNPEADFQRFGLFLTDIKQINPIPAKGRQGIWNYNNENKNLTTEEYAKSLEDVKYKKFRHPEIEAMLGDKSNG